VEYGEHFRKNHGIVGDDESPGLVRATAACLEEGFGFDFGGGGHSVTVNSAKQVKHVVAHVAISYQAVKTSTPNSLCKLHVVGFSRRPPEAPSVSR
jgi:hypothetical protein